MYLFIFILKSVCGILNFFSVVRFMVDLAALSAWSFPLMKKYIKFNTEICHEFYSRFVNYSVFKSYLFENQLLILSNIEQVLAATPHENYPS